MADHYPRITRAPQDTKCEGCGTEGADVRLTTPLGTFLVDLGPKCRALLAAPPEREVFEAVETNGARVWYRADGKGEVEWSYNRENWHGSFCTESVGRAIVQAYESGRGQ